MTPAKLRNHTAKDLAQMAKKHGVPGWHAMRKDQLVDALVKSARRRNGRAKTAATTNGKATNGKATNGKATNGKAPARKSTAAAKRKAAAEQKRNNPRIVKQITQLRAKLEGAKDLAAANNGHGPTKDRLIVMVRDPFWLHAYWELSRQSVARVQAALGQHWHTARPQLRLFEVSNHGTATASEALIRSVEIHGGVSNWYLDVQDPPKTYRVHIGYLASDGEFHVVARSNIVSTPAAGLRDALDHNWTDVAENYDRIFAMSGGYAAEGSATELQELMEERLRRPMGSPAITRFGLGAGSLLDPGDDFALEADAEMIVYGATKPNAHVTLKGEPVRLRPDGTFTVRINMPDRRQVVPVVASSSDGVEQRTVVIAVERNTKRMETVTRDAME